jgi:hypothetical protein
VAADAEPGLKKGIGRVYKGDLPPRFLAKSALNFSSGHRTGAGDDDCGGAAAARHGPIEMSPLIDGHEAKRGGGDPTGWGIRWSAILGWNPFIYASITLALRTQSKRRLTKASRKWPRMTRQTGVVLSRNLLESPLMGLGGTLIRETKIAIHSI